MSNDPKTKSELTGEERRLIDALRHHFEPPPLSEARQRALQARLEERLARRTGWRLEPWALAAAAVTAGLALFFVMRNMPGVEPTSAPNASLPELATTTAAGTLEPLSPEEMILALSGEEELIDLDDEIPDDYRAIDALLLEGV